MTMTPTKAELCVTVLVAVALIATTTPAWPAGPSVVILSQRGVDADLAERIEESVRARRAVLPLRPMPEETRAPEDLANEQRVAAIAQALQRARQHEEVAGWDACTKEAGDMLGSATEVLATQNRLELLRDLHLQIGACMSLGPEPESAQPHFRSATLLDETPPPKGLHREEAERALEAARADVLRLQRGPVRIETDPPGAEVWIDGKQAPGVTPLTVPARLGTHFVTVRRFRYEPDTRAMHLQPKTRVRLVMHPARRDTLTQQLAEVNAGKREVPAGELQLARALWSRAGQLLLLEPAKGAAQQGAVSATLLGASTGATVKRRVLSPALDDDQLMLQVCALLGERCEVESSSVFASPWFWIATGVALVGGAIAVGFAVDSQRGAVFCPSGGC